MKTLVSNHSMWQVFGSLRQLLCCATLFSFFVNVFMLLPSIYMLQVFDRVLTSGSNETLLMLMLATVMGLVVMMVLALLRARLLVSIRTDALMRSVGSTC
jgi:ATP-binding cassette subfamily C protein EexD